MMISLGMVLFANYLVSLFNDNDFLIRHSNIILWDLIIYNFTGNPAGARMRQHIYNILNSEIHIFSQSVSEGETELWKQCTSESSCKASSGSNFIDFSLLEDLDEYELKITWNDGSNYIQWIG